MNISIKNNTATLVKEDTLVEDSKKTYTVNFEFDSSWDEIDKAAVFKAGLIIVDDVEITSNACSVPAECLKEGGFSLYVGVRKTEDEEDSGIIWCNAGRIMFNIVDGKGGSDDEGGESGGGITTVIIETNAAFTEVVQSSHTVEEIRQMFAQNTPMCFVIKIAGEYEGMPFNVFVQMEYKGQININGTTANGPGVSFTYSNGATYSVTVTYDGFQMLKN